MKTPSKEDIIIMMGNLHIEMAALRALGILLDNSGWIEALVTTGVTTRGRAVSMSEASHFTRT